jgi:hypothetical protein
MSKMCCRKQHMQLLLLWDVFFINRLLFRVTTFVKFAYIKIVSFVTNNSTGSSSANNCSVCAKGTFSTSRGNRHKVKGFFLCSVLTICLESACYYINLYSIDHYWLHRSDCRFNLLALSRRNISEFSWY